MSDKSPTLWIPQDEPTAYKCLTCGAGFPEHQKSQYVRHATNCSKQIEDEMAAFIEEQQKNPLSQPSDPEAHEWKKKRLSEGKRATDGRGGLA